MLSAETADAVVGAPTRRGKRKRTDQIICESRLLRRGVPIAPGRRSPPSPVPLPLRQCLAFASELERRLPLEWVGLSTTAETLTADIQDHIDALRSSRMGAFGDQDADRLGTNLWNQATRLRREIKDDAGPSKRRKLLLCTRVFAFQLLDLAHWSETDTTASQAARLLKVSLKASRSCIGKPVPGRP